MCQVVAYKRLKTMENAISVIGKREVLILYCFDWEKCVFDRLSVKDVVAYKRLTLLHMEVQLYIIILFL